MNKSKYSMRTYYQIQLVDYENQRSYSYNHLDGWLCGWGYGLTTAVQLDRALMFESTEQVQEFWTAISNYRRNHKIQLVITSRSGRIKKCNDWSYWRDYLPNSLKKNSVKIYSPYKLNGIQRELDPSCYKHLLGKCVS
jgi:hypothetical protein